jgi:hypothetical protein
MTQRDQPTLGGLMFNVANADGWDAKHSLEILFSRAPHLAEEAT